MKYGVKLEKPVTLSPRKRPVSYRLPAPFCHCPVCGGTTTLDSSPQPANPRLYSVCYSCNTRWDLKGEIIAMGAVTRLPLVAVKKDSEVLH